MLTKQRTANKVLTNSKTKLNYEKRLRVFKAPPNKLMDVEVTTATLFGVAWFLSACVVAVSPHDISSVSLLLTSVPTNCNMKVIPVIFVFLLFFFVINPFSFGQTNAKTPIDIASLAAEVRKNAKYITWHDRTEYSSNFKKTFEFKGEKLKRDVELFESVCGRRNCLKVLVEDNGVRVSPQKLQRNRQKLGKELEKLDAAPAAINANEENADEYGFQINGVILQPSLYLKICDISSPERVFVDLRPTIKIRFSNCNTDNEPSNYKSYLRHMPNTEGSIWIDEQDKMITRLEAVAKPSAVSNAANKPALALSMARVPAGFWFWSSIRLEAIDNKTIFPELRGNWQIDFSNCRRFRVDVAQPKIGKP